jgi:hypothetical protein
MKVLLEKGEDNIQVGPEVAVAAAENEESGRRVIAGRQRSFL